MIRIVETGRLGSRFDLLFVEIRHDRLAFPLEESRIVLVFRRRGRLRSTAVEMGDRLGKEALASMSNPPRHRPVFHHDRRTQRRQLVIRDGTDLTLRRPTFDRLSIDLVLLRDVFGSAKAETQGPYAPFPGLIERDFARAGHRQRGVAASGRALG